MPETTSRAIAAMGLPHHPPPHELAGFLREAASRLEEHGVDAIDLASVLAGRGYAASTIGDGGSRGTDSTSSTERSGTRAIREVDPLTGKPRALPPETRWYGADEVYASLLRDAWKIAIKVTARTDEILRHADTVDPTPAGTGECLACGRFCRPDKDRPGNRLRSGLCPTDYRAWARANKPVRAEWVRQRRQSFTDPDTKALHTPEPDHDIDLSVELPDSDPYEGATA